MQNTTADTHTNTETENDASVIDDANIGYYETMSYHFDFMEEGFWRPVRGTRSGDGKKVRADAVLKNLSPQAQEKVMDWATRPLERSESGIIISGTGGLIFAVGELRHLARKFKRPELAVSTTAVARFVQWWDMQRNMEEAQERVEQLCAEKLEPGDIAQMREAAEVILMRLGIAECNGRRIVAAARMQDSRRKLELKEARLQWEKDQVNHEMNEERQKKERRAELVRQFNEKCAMEDRARLVEIERKEMELKVRKEEAARQFAAMEEAARKAGGSEGSEGSAAVSAAA